MQHNKSLGFIFFLYLSLALLAVDADGDDTKMQTYIVWVRKPPGYKVSSLDSGDLESWYHTFLPDSQTTTGATSEERRSKRMVYAYHNVATGFAARLTPEEVKEMEKKEGFLHAQPETLLPLHTTHSPNFLGLQQQFGLWEGTNYGKGMIIAVFDTGISPDHPSFSDEGMPPPPEKWKGKCDGIVCNNKVIGARTIQNGTITGVSPFDEKGHGTHTASTAAGNFVEGASMFGTANGTASGVAPNAHLAIYKVCDEKNCPSSDILKAFDTAIDDGVDVISVSLGQPSQPFHEDVQAIGAFKAIENGIFVSFSAGNDGPSNRTLSNEAPWMLTVGASTMDRKITSAVQLGSSEQFFGESVFPSNFSSSPSPLVYQTEFCAPDSLGNVEGKVVVCEKGGNISSVHKGEEVKRAGGVAMILVNPMIDGLTTIVEDDHVLPVTLVDYAAGLKIKSYIDSTETPMATILPPSTVIGDSLAPVVASFSSRGPSIASPGILKPDIIGPGVNILASWPRPVDNAVSPATFNIISGTSMSCPHLSGIAALIKSQHSDWSPAAIKSAIMTTADQLNLQGTQIIDSNASPADIFSTGSGHVNPSKANDPGLIYDIQPEDYIPYLCGLYAEDQVERITHQSVSCSEAGYTSEAQLNYPSFLIRIGSYGNQTYTRTVTNVGPADSTYNLELAVPESVNINVSPSVLTFTEDSKTMTYSVEFSTQEAGQNDTFTQGYLRWVSDKYSVYSPIAVLFQS